MVNALAEREQLRMRDLQSVEELNRKDDGLGSLLNKLNASISGRPVDVTGQVGELPCADHMAH